MKPRSQEIVAQSARIGARVRAYRKLRQFSQEGFAREVGLSRMQVHRIEVDARDLSAQEVLRIAQALGMTVEELIGPALAAAATVMETTAGGED